MSQEHYKDLNLTRPEEGFEPYRYKSSEKMRTSGCRYFTSPDYSRSRASLMNKATCDFE
jgi:hypothetical protein